MNEKHEKELTEKGFKRKYTFDKSGYWLEKPFVIGLIKGAYIYDELQCSIEVWTVDDERKELRPIWEGKYKKFIQYLNKYDK